MSRRRPLSWGRIAVAIAMAGLACETGAVAAAGIDGIWKLSAPQALLAPVAGQAIPFTEEGRKAWEANKQAAATGDYRFDPTKTACASPGQPRLMLTPMRFAILKRASMVTIVYEWNRLFRQITVGKQLRNPLLPADYKDFPFSQGYAEGHWEGGTLVVTTVGLAGDKLLDALVPSSDMLELSERLRLLDPETLEDRITITDPAMFTRAWTTVLTYKRQPDRLFPFAEDVCLDRLKAGKPPIG